MTHYHSGFFLSQDQVLEVTTLITTFYPALFYRANNFSLKSSQAKVFKRTSGAAAMVQTGALLHHVDKVDRKKIFDPDRPDRTCLNKQKINIHWLKID